MSHNETIVSGLSLVDNGEHPAILSNIRMNDSLIVKAQTYEQTIADIQNQLNQNILENMYPRARNDTKAVAVHDGQLIERTARAISEYDKQNWLERTFSPMTPGSLRGSIITLMSTALVSGILSLPYVVAETGLVIGSLFIVLGALNALMSMYLLMKACFKTGINKYSELVKHCFGPGWSLFF